MPDSVAGWLAAAVATPVGGESGWSAVAPLIRFPACSSTGAFRCHLSPPSTGPDRDTHASCIDKVLANYLITF